MRARLRLGSVFTDFKNLISDDQDAVTAWGTSVLAIFAVITAIIGWGTLRRTRLDSAARTRPYVYAKLEPSIGSRQAWDLVIRNVGQTAAKNLTLESKWPNREDDVTRELKRLFETKRTLPPGTSIRTYWNLDPIGQDDGQNAGITEPVEVTVNYTSGVKGLFRSPRHSETYEIDHTTVGMTPTGWSGMDKASVNWDPVERRLKEIVSALSELRRNL